MAWYAVVDDGSGRLVSVGTVLADPMPKGLAVLDCGEKRPDGRGIGWDEESRRFVPLPPPETDDLLDDALADADLAPVLTRVSIAEQETLKTILRRYIPTGLTEYNRSEASALSANSRVAT